MTPANLPHPITDQMRYAVYLEQLAEALYDTAVMCDLLGETPVTWERLPQSMKSRYRTAAGTMLALVAPEVQS